jgi:hypothetical protein
MHHTAGIAQRSRTLSPVAAGLGAAVVAISVTLAMTMGSGTTSAQEDQPSTTAQQCQLMARKLLVSTTTGGGTVRLRGGSYLSPPMILSSTPQGVVFPLARPDVVPVQEVITIEGNASNVVITSVVTNFRRVYDVHGVTAFDVTWKPIKSC